MPNSHAVGCIGRGASPPASTVGVDALVIAVCNLISFVPDADGAVRFDALVEGFPGWEVDGVTGLGVSDEMVEAAPVLGNHDSAPVKGWVGGKQAQRRASVEFFEHRAHGFGNSAPGALPSSAVPCDQPSANRERPLWCEHFGMLTDRSCPACRPMHGDCRRTHRFVTDCPTPAHQALRGWIVAHTRAGVGQSLTRTTFGSAAMGWGRGRRVTGAAE